MAEAIPWASLLFSATAILGAAAALTPVLDNIDVFIGDLHTRGEGPALPRPRPGSPFFSRWSKGSSARAAPDEIPPIGEIVPIGTIFSRDGHRPLRTSKHAEGTNDH